MRTTLVLLAVSSLLAGCASIGPDAPSKTISPDSAPPVWRQAMSQKVRATSPWWDPLEDKTLTSLVQSALTSSPTLETAQSRILVARANRLQTFSAGKPTVSAIGQTSRAQSGALEVQQAQASAKLDAAWELDLFGAVRRGQEGANARVATAEYNLAAARVSLSAEVATGYLQYRACRASLALNQQDLESRRATLTLTKASVDVGRTAPYLLTRTQASWEEATAQRAALTAQCEQLENLLSRLTGVELPKLLTLLQQPLRQELLDKTLDLWALGLPTDVLALRPDVQAAQSNWAAATADVGLAMADQLPRLTLSGGLSYGAQDAGTRVSFGGWSFGPTLSIPLLDGGRRAAATQGAQARLQEAQAAYAAALDLAVQEVNDGLVRYQASVERKAAASAAALQYKKFFQAVDLRHRAGMSSLLELEDARRAWLAASAAEVSAKQEHIQSWVYLNKVTAGATTQSQEQPQ